MVGLVLFFFCFFAVLGLPWGRFGESTVSRVIGSITYPLYLLHAHAGYMILSHFATPENQVAVYATLIPAMITLAYIVHYGIEKRAAPLWHNLFERLAGPVLHRLERAGPGAAAVDTTP